MSDRDLAAYLLSSSHPTPPLHPFFRSENTPDSEDQCTDHHVRLCFSFMGRAAIVPSRCFLSSFGAAGRDGSGREKLKTCCIDDVPQHLMEVGSLQPRSHHPEMETYKNKIHMCMPLRFLAEHLLRRL